MKKKAGRKYKIDCVTFLSDCPASALALVFVVYMGTECTLKVHQGAVERMKEIHHHQIDSSEVQERVAALFLGTLTIKY